MTIRGPDRRVYAESKDTLHKTQIEAFQAIGRRTVNAPLKPGVYTGMAVLLRQAPDGPVTRTIEQSVTVK